MNILNALGLVRATAHAALDEQRRKADARAAKLAETVDASRGEARDWKAKAADAEKRARDFEREAAKQSERGEKVRADLAGQLETERARVAELLALKQRLADAERELAVARDLLMAIDVKLDILEGAANVLDGRTRTVLAAASRPASDPTA